MNQDLCQLCVDKTKAADKSLNTSAQKPSEPKLSEQNEQIIDLETETLNLNYNAPTISNEQEMDDDSTSDEDIPRPPNKTKRNMIFDVEDD